MDNDSKFTALLMGLLLLCAGLGFVLLWLSVKGWPDAIWPFVVSHLIMCVLFAASVPVAHYLVFGDEPQ